MRLVEHTEYTTASSKTLWRFKSNPSKWPEWDQDLDEVVFNGPFQVGSQGTIKPKNMSKMPFVLTEVTEELSYQDKTRISWLTDLVFTHTITPTDHGSSFTTTVEVEGLFSWFFGCIMMREMKKDVPIGMKNLKNAAEKYEKKQ